MQCVDPHHFGFCEQNECLLWSIRLSGISFISHHLEYMIHHMSKTDDITAIPKRHRRRRRRRMTDDAVFDHIHQITDAIHNQRKIQAPSPVRVHGTYTAISRPAFTTYIIDVYTLLYTFPVNPRAKIQSFGHRYAELVIFQLLCHFTSHASYKSYVSRIHV